MKQIRLLEEQNALLQEQNTLLGAELGLTKQKLHRLLGPDLSQLPDAQRKILQAVQKLSVDNIKGIKHLIGQLEGVEASEGLIKSLSALLREKALCVICTTCKSQSTLSWAKDTRYANDGHARFSHPISGGRTASHSSMTRIPQFEIALRTPKKK